MINLNPGFHMIATIAVIAAIADFFFSAITAMVAIIWKPGFNLIIAYFKRKGLLAAKPLFKLCINMKKP